jgi:hypothetical protein
MAAQFNSNVAADTKKVLEKRAREDDDRRAREALERNAARMPRASAPEAPRFRGSERQACVTAV